MCKKVTRQAVSQSLFRRKAVQAAGYRLFGSVTTALPPSAGIAIIASALIVAALIAAVTIIEVPLRSRAVGVLVPAGGLIDVVARQPGHVATIGVVAGEVVPKSHLLLSVASSDGATLGGAPPQVYLTSLRKELHLLENAANDNQRIAATRERFLRQEVGAIERQLLLSRNLTDAHAEQTSLVERNIQRNRSLAENGHVTRAQFDQQVASLLKSRSDGTEKEFRVAQLEHDLDAAKHALTEHIERAVQQSNLHAIETERLHREIAAANYAVLNEYRAPEAAQIAHILVQPGDVVQAGQVVAKLRRPGALLEAWLYVSTSQARMLQRGQSVEVKLDAYPQEVFGTFSATVISTSGVALLPTDVDVPLMISGPVFEVRAALNDNQVGFGSTRWPLQPGISFQADIVQRRLRLYEWLLRTISHKTDIRV